MDKAQNIAQLIDYQENSVVSKTLLKQKNGNITLFAFDKGQGLSEHTAPFDAWCQIVDGRAAVKVGDTTHDMKAGDAIIFPANIPHALDGSERFKMLLVMIKE